MFSTFTSAPLASFRFAGGEDLIRTFKSSEDGRRLFCGGCGSVAPTILKEMGIVLIPAGNLHADPGIRPQMHMFAASRASWYPITDGLPQHAGYPPEFGGGQGITRPVPAVRLGIAHGSCLCDAVAWEFTGQPERVQNCHCTRCRRARSAAHATNAFYKREQLTWLRGEADITGFSLKAAKYFGQDFCRHCGSPVPRVVEATGYVVVPCGSFDTALSALPLGNVFATSKAEWYEITDGLPQWDAYPPRS